MKVPGLEMARKVPKIVFQIWGNFRFSLNTYNLSVQVGIIGEFTALPTLATDPGNRPWQPLPKLSTCYSKEMFFLGHAVRPKP